MDSNLSLSIGLKGQVKVQAQAVPLQEGYLKLGGIAAADLAFGVVVSADPDTLNEFEAGVADGNVIRGIAVYDDAIAENALAHPGKYLAGMPCAVINHGFFYLGKWGKTQTSTIDPTPGCVIIYKDATGEIEFKASGASAPSNWSVLSTAKVVDVDADNGALIYIG